jgi:DNA helicase-2/ATP-dependent DNA helicase PcrA
MGIDLQQHLNPQQLEAANTIDGAVLILAGAGSGKTRVITYRMLHMIDNLGIRPESILAVTFTNKAADQMKTRVRERLDSGRSADPWISTFHSFCVRLLRREIEVLGYGRQFTIYDSDDQLQVVKGLMKEYRIEDLKPRLVQSRISSAKTHRISPTKMADDAFQPDWEQTARVYADYQKRLKKANALDFDDLLSKTVELFEKFPDVAAAYSNRFRYIMVDEYQDTNRTQYKLIRHLSGQHGNVCVVGDEDQSIYSWRGADIQNILDFEKDYPDVRTVRLEQNYRSTKNILLAAGAVVANNELRKGKDLWTENSTGDKIQYFEAQDPEQEAAFVAEKIRDLCRSSRDASIAVLYRTNFLSRTLEEMFRRWNIPYRVAGGFSFYERAEIKDIVSYMTAALNPDDSVHLLRILNTPTRGIGRTTVDALLDRAAEREVSLWDSICGLLDDPNVAMRSRRSMEGFRGLMDDLIQSAQDMNSGELIELIIDKSGYSEMLLQEGTDEALTRVDNIRELLNAAQESAERGESLRDFLDNAALVSDQDQYDEQVQVTLMTLHTAKGLEFPSVFIIGMEDGLFPHSRSIEESKSLEEERRLFYVGMTRAEERLYLTASRYRRTFGTMEPMLSEVSRFLHEIPPEFMDGLAEASVLESEPRERTTYGGNSYNTVDAVKNFLNTKPKSGGRSGQGSGPKSGKWSQGTRVKHPKYGVGTVLRTEGSGGDAKLTVSFNNFGMKKLIARYASLEVV